jgi:predicted ATPase
VLVGSGAGTGDVVVNNPRRKMVMYKINHIKIEGFIRLNNIDLPIRPLMVIIDANGVGKTSLLDAYSLLSASATGALNGGLQCQ